MKEERILVVLDDSFPYGEKGEPWLEEEQKYWYGFDKIYLAPMTDQCGIPIKRKSLSHIKLIPATKEKKIFKLIRLFTKIIWETVLWKEIWLLLKSNRLNIYRLKQMVGLENVANYESNKIQKALKKDGVKVDTHVVFYSYWMYKPAYVACVLKKVYKRSYCITRCHGYDIYEERQKTNYLPFRYAIFANMDKIFCICQQGKKYLSNRYGLISKKVYISHLGSVDNGAQSFKRDYLTFNVVSCSNVIPIKRVDLILSGLIIFASNHPDIRINWTHYGDGELLGKIKASLPESIINLSCHFTGFIKHSELMKELYKSRADVFINTSSAEGVPVSIMEAISLGIPVIATDVGGVSEIIHDKENGLLLSDKITEEDVARAFEKIYFVSDEEYREMRKKARFSWEKDWDAQKNYREFAKNLVTL